eukprot:1848510-Pleurochrysis_carterae.AAC.1
MRDMLAVADADCSASCSWARSRRISAAREATFWTARLHPAAPRLRLLSAISASAAAPPAAVARPPLRPRPPASAARALPACPLLPRSLALPVPCAVRARPASLPPHHRLRPVRRGACAARTRMSRPPVPGGTPLPPPTSSPPPSARRPLLPPPPRGRPAPPPTPLRRLRPRI